MKYACINPREQFEIIINHQRLRASDEGSYSTRILW